MIVLHIEQRSRIDQRAVVVDSVARLGVAEGTCPGCGAQPFQIRCEPSEHIDSETERAGGRCLRCNDPVGWVYERQGTIFGAEEDRAMTQFARSRVYGLEAPRG